MTNLMDDQSAIFYVVRVNGQDKSGKLTSQMLAEMAKSKLTEEEQMIAEVVPVNSNGQQLLLG